MIHFCVKLHVQNIIMKNIAALSGDLPAWEAEAEQPGSEEIAPVSCFLSQRQRCLVFTWV